MSPASTQAPASGSADTASSFDWGQCPSCGAQVTADKDTTCISCGCSLLRRIRGGRVYWIPSHLGDFQLSQVLHDAGLALWASATKAGGPDAYWLRIALGEKSSVATFDLGAAAMPVEKEGREGSEGRMSFSAIRASGSFLGARVPASASGKRLKLHRVASIVSAAVPAAQTLQSAKGDPGALRPASLVLDASGKLRFVASGVKPAPSGVSAVAYSQAVASLWYELLSGERPAKGVSLSDLRQQTPPEWVAAIEAGLSEASLPLARYISVLTAPQRRARNRKLAIAAGVTIAVGGAAVGVWQMSGSKQQTDTRITQEFQTISALAREGSSFAKALDGLSGRTSQWASLASSGNAQAAYLLGLCYRDGRGVSQDMAKAQGLFESAREIALAQYELGLIYSRQKKPDQASVAFQQAAAGGVVPAQFEVGRIFWESTPRQADKAVVAFMEASKGSIPGAAFYAGLAYRDGLGGVPRDLGKAREAFARGAKQGDIQALVANAVEAHRANPADPAATTDMSQVTSRLAKGEVLRDNDARQYYGVALLEGRGIPANPAEAVKWLSDPLSIARQMRQQGKTADAVAQYEKSQDRCAEDDALWMARTLADGTGVAANPAKAAEWAELKVLASSGEARYLLWRLRQTQSPIEAEKNLREAVRLNYPLAKPSLAQFLLKSARDDDHREAFRLLVEAGSAPTPDLTYDVGVALRDGTLVQKDVAAAQAWFAKVADTHGPSALALGDLQLAAKDAAGAQKSWTKAYELGQKPAALKLATLFRTEKPDGALALTWLEKIADELPGPDLVWAAGESLRQGRADAQSWYSRAAKKNIAEAYVPLARLVEKTSPDEFKSLITRAAAADQVDAMVEVYGMTLLKEASDDGLAARLAAVPSAKLLPVAGALKSPPLSPRSVERGALAITQLGLARLATDREGALSLLRLSVPATPEGSAATADGDARYQLGLADIAAKDTKSARAWLEKSAAREHLPSVRALADLERKEGNEAAAKKWFDVLSAKGDPQGVVEAARQLAKVGKKDLAVAKFLSVPGIADLVTPAESLMVGQALATGQGVKADGVAAIAWYRSAAKGGEAQAVSPLGKLLLWGSTDDQAEALTWLRKAADGGDIDAARQCAIADAIGWGRKEAAIAQAYEVFAKLAPTDAEAAIWAARMEQEGLGRRVAPAEARKFLAPFAKNPQTQFMLGLTYALDYTRPEADRGTVPAEWRLEARKILEPAAKTSPAAAVALGNLVLASGEDGSLKLAETMLAVGEKSTDPLVKARVARVFAGLQPEEIKDRDKRLAAIIAQASKPAEVIACHKALEATGESRSRSSRVAQTLGPVFLGSAPTDLAQVVVLSEILSEFGRAIADDRSRTDIKPAIPYLELAAALGNPDAWFRLARFDDDKAILRERMERASRLGRLEATWNLSLMLGAEGNNARAKDLRDECSRRGWREARD